MCSLIDLVALAVFLCIQRRHLEQVKAALPAILEVLYACSSESDDEEKDNYQDLFRTAVGIGTSIQAICGKMVCFFDRRIFMHSQELIVYNLFYIKSYPRTCNRLEEEKKSYMQYLVFMSCKIQLSINTTSLSLCLYVFYDLIILSNGTLGSCIKKQTCKYYFKLLFTCSAIF